jgi:hypothetical protein
LYHRPFVLPFLCSSLPGFRLEALSVRLTVFTERTENDNASETQARSKGDEEAAGQIRSPRSVCVRYRYDEASGTRVKTVELVVEKVAWRPPRRKFSDNDLVPVRIGYADSALGKKAKAAKGRWSPEKKMWFMRYGNIKGTSRRKIQEHLILDTRA